MGRQNTKQQLRLYTSYMAIKNQNIWIPFADTMTALMLIFLLIVVLILSVVPREDLSTEVQLEEFEIVLDDLYEELSVAFANRRDEWGVRVLEDLTIKFENPNILFDQDSAAIKDEFKEILNDFIPTYLKIVTKEKYEETVKEIKIEGHTANISPIHNTYIKTVQLSQERAREILEYILYHEHFNALLKEEQERITFLLSANGFGYGRAIDGAGEFVYTTKEPISQNSRRVEFRIVTNSDELVKQLTEKK